MMSNFHQFSGTGQMFYDIVESDNIKQIFFVRIFFQFRSLDREKSLRIDGSLGSNFDPFGMEPALF